MIGHGPTVAQRPDIHNDAEKSGKRTLTADSVPSTPRARHDPCWPSSQSAIVAPPNRRTRRHPRRAVAAGESDPLFARPRPADHAGCPDRLQPLRPDPVDRRQFIEPCQRALVHDRPRTLATDMRDRLQRREIRAVDVDRGTVAGPIRRLGRRLLRLGRRQPKPRAIREFLLPTPDYEASGVGNTV